MKLKKTVSVAFLAFFLLLPHINAQGEKTLDFKEYIPGGDLHSFFRSIFREVRGSSEG